MAKKPSVQTVAVTAKTLQKASSLLAPAEERALRMRAGVGLSTGEALAQKVSQDDAVAEQLARLELLAFKAMGQQIYGIGKSTPAAAKAVSHAAPTLAARSSKDKIIKALKKR